MSKTSYGQQLLRRQIELLFPSELILENHRPEWLNGLELDLFIPRLNLAFEYQGDQHYVALYGWNNLMQQQRRDKLKRRICYDRGVVIVRIDAVHLWHSKIKGRIKCVGNWQLQRRVRWPYAKPVKAAVRALDAECGRYRELLRNKFNSASVRNPGKSRGAIIRAVNAPLVPKWRPTPVPFTGKLTEAPPLKL